MPKISIWEFFELDNEGCSYSSVSPQTLKKMAWRGDSILSWIVSTRIWEFEDSSSTIGELTNKKNKYVCNFALEKFLKDKTDILDYFPLEKDKPSTHSFGTMFEYLLYLCYNKDTEKAQLIVEQLIDFIDENEDDSVDYHEDKNFGVVSDDDDVQSTDSFELYANHIRKIGEEKPKKKMQYRLVMQRVMALNVKRAEENPYCNFDFTKDTKITLVHSNASEIEKVTWRSRKHNNKISSFWKCCGLRADYGLYDRSSLQCGLNTWDDDKVDWIHTGSMTISCSRRVGGGRSPTGGSDDHMGLSRWPTWSCCRRLSFEEGCKNPKEIENSVNRRFQWR